MKRWRKYVFSIWTPVVILAALNLHLWLRTIDFDINPCGYYDVTTLSHKQGNFDVVWQRSCCYRGCTVRIVLRRLRSDTTIFVYESAGYDPVAAWLSPDHLEIAVNRVNHIYSQLAEARGVKVTYRIEKVDDPYP